MTTFSHILGFTCWGLIPGLMAPAIAAQLGSYDFEGGTGQELVDKSNAVGVIASDFSYHEPGGNPVGVGEVVTSEGGLSAFRTTAWLQNGDNPNDALNVYLSFTLQADGGLNLNLDQLSLDALRGGNETPDQLVVRSSQDGFSTNLVDRISNQSIFDIPSALTPFSITLNLDSNQFTNVQNVEFRLAGFRALANGDLGGNLRRNSLVVDNIRVQGEAVPFGLGATESSAVAIALGLITARHLRRRSDSLKVQGDYPQPPQT